MLRSVTLGVALSVLAAACALVEPPQGPPRTQAITVEVRNETRDPLAFSVTTPNGVVPGGAQPTSMGRGLGTIAFVTFHVPIEGAYSIVLSREHSLEKGKVAKLFKPGCTPFIQVEFSGFSHPGCKEDLVD